MYIHYTVESPEITVFLFLKYIYTLDTIFVANSRSENNFTPIIQSQK